MLKRRIRNHALGVTMTVLAAAAASAAPALTVPASAASAMPAVEICGQGPAVVRPGSVILTCADYGEIAKNLRWTSWSATQATATGTVTWRSGDASLSRSKGWSAAAADITLTSPAEPGGKVLFTRLVVRMTGRTPSRFHRDQAFDEAPLPAPPPVTHAPAPPAAAAAPALSPAAASGTLSYARIEGFWQDAGGPASQAETAAAITGAESSFLPGIIQQGVDYCGAGSDRAGWGLWQITCGNEIPAYGTNFQLLDPWNNAEAAVYLYDARGFEPWTTYEDGAYEAYLENGVAADTALTDPGQYDQDGSTPPGTATSPDPGSTDGPALNPYLATFEDNDSYLYGYEDFSTDQGSNAGTTLGMDPGTSPSTAGLSNGSTYITAFQDNDNYLYLRTSGGTNIPTTLGMDPGTSPAVAALAADDDWVAAFQDNDNYLYLRTSGGTNIPTTVGMDPGTSPAIAGSGGGWIVAFEDNDHDLDIVTSANLEVNTTLGMQPGTSPAITALANGGFAVAFQANTSHLYTLVTNGTSASAVADGTRTQTQYGMNTSSSPAIASYGNSWEAAFETNDQYLYTYLSNGTDVQSTLGMDAGTSPAIAAEPDGSFYLIAFDDNDNNLYLTTSTGTNIGTPLGMQPGTNPTVGTPQD